MALTKVSGSVLKNPLSLSGNVSVGGTLTYEDVTNVDAVGVVTAREGIRVGAGKSIGSDGAAVVYYGDGSNLTGISAGAGGNTGLDLNDNVKIRLGTGNDIEFYHSGSHNFIDITNGQLRIRHGTDNAIKTIADGAVILYYDGGQRIQTTTGGIEISGETITNSHIELADNARLKLGTGEDLQAWHDGTNTNITNSKNDLNITNTGDDIVITANDDINLKTNAGDNAVNILGGAAVELYHNASKKFETRGNGTQVTGTVLAGSSTPAAENSTYVFQAVGASQAFISAYASNTGTNLNSHGMHFGQDTSRGYLTQRENKDIYFYTNNAHRLTLSNSGHLVPASNNTYDLGTSSIRWRNVYTNDLNLSNEGSQNDVDGTWGDYTIQEGESDLFLINKRSGKKFKFMLQEVN